MSICSPIPDSQEVADYLSMSDDQACFSTATGTDRTQLKMDCAKCINFDKATEKFKVQLNLKIEEELKVWKERLAAAKDHCDLCNARCNPKVHDAKIVSFMNMTLVQQVAELRSMHLTQEQMEEYAKVSMHSSTNSSAKAHIASNETQLSLASVVTEGQHKQLLEKKHADLAELVKVLHYVFMQNSDKSAIKLSVLLN
jgi:hypothetical protein